MKALRILHCPHNFAGNPGNLAKVERKIGLKSWAVTCERNFFSYHCDEYVGDEKFFKKEFKRWKLFFRALFQFDIIHFNAGHSIMPDWSTGEKYTHPFFKKLHHFYIRFFTLKDLFVLKLFKKGIAVTYQGDDARQGEFCKKNFKITFVNEVPRDYYVKAYDLFKKRKIQTFEKYADCIYSLNPDLLYVLPKKAKFLPYAHINLDEWLPVYVSKNEDRILTVVHAPSDRLVKGTKYIVTAVERLKKEGLRFNFILVENMPNEKAKEIYKKADILIDQLLAGWYGGLAVELMALGKPVIAYIRKEDLKFIPARMKNELPIINATPKTIFNVLKKYITTDKGKLVSIGGKSRQYVERWHDPIKITKRLERDYKRILKKN